MTLPIAVVLCAALLAGCQVFGSTGGESSDEPPPETPAERVARAYTTLVEPVWTADFEPIGKEAVRAADVVLVLASERNAPQVVAFDAESGTRLWSAPHYPGARKPEVRWGPNVALDSQGKPVTLTLGLATETANGLKHPLELRDARTGKLRTVLGRYWSSSPRGCDDSLCVNVWLENSPDGAGAWYTAQVNIDENRLDIKEKTAQPGNLEWHVTKNLWLDGGKDTLDWEIDHQKVWSKKLSDYLPPGLSPKNFNGFGFQFAVDDPANPQVVVMSVRPHADESLGGTFAFSIADGTPLWNSSDALLCQFGTAITCDKKKVLEAEKSSGWTRVTDISGIDVRTGEEQWTTTLERGVATEDSMREDNPRMDATGFFAIRGGKPLEVLDERSGAVIPLPADAALACWDDTSWSGPGSSSPGEKRETFASGVVVRACDPDGKPVDAAMSRQAVADSVWSSFRDGEHRVNGMIIDGPAEDPLDDVESWYYLQTPEGISAYRF